MAYTYQSPGVFREDVFVRSAAALPTGVPGFVGFGRTVGGEPVLLHRVEDLARQFSADAGVDGYLADAVAGFFANGGQRCHVAAAAPGNDPAGVLAKALESLGLLDDLDLVAVPDAMTLVDRTDGAAAMLSVQRAVLKHCHSHGNRFAILDAPAGRAIAGDAVAATLAWQQALTANADNPANGALYFPWVKVASASQSAARLVPPSGHVAGVYARSDRNVGVYKAPANEELQAVLDLAWAVDAAAQDVLNPAGINCLRAFPGRGLRVWGARTLSQDPTWRHVNVRRLVLTFGRWLDRNLIWATFEPNTPRLWNRLAREISAHLDRWYRSGALKGASAADAYYVKCDAETNPVQEREQGRVTTEVGLAPAMPGEFIVVRIIHREGATALSA